MTKQKELTLLDFLAHNNLIATILAGLIAIIMYTIQATVYMSKLATKEDIRQMSNELKQQIKDIDKEGTTFSKLLQSHLSSLEKDFTNHVNGSAMLR